MKNAPPEKIQKVIRMIYLLLNNEKTAWDFEDKAIKSFLVKIELKELKEYLQKLESVSEQTIKTLKNQTEKDKNWNEKAMEECSAMCLNFYKWVNSIAACYYLKKETRPLLDNLKV